MMYMRKYIAAIALSSALCACQQDEVSPATPKPAASPEQTVELSMLVGASSPQNESDELRKVTYSQTPIEYTATMEYNLRRINGEDDERRMSYSGMSDAITDEGIPNPFFGETSTTLTCIIKSDNPNQPTTIVDVDWQHDANSASATLVNKQIALAQGTDLTQDNWYIMVFGTTNGGASGQTFSFDKNTGLLTVTTPATPTSYYDVKIASSNGNVFSSRPENYANVPGFWASAWAPLTVSSGGSRLDAPYLQMQAQGSLLMCYNEYLVQSLMKIVHEGQTQEAYLAFDSRHKTQKETILFTGVNADNIREKFSDLLTANSIVEPFEAKLSLPSFVTTSGVYDLLPDGVLPEAGKHTLTYTPTDDVSKPLTRKVLSFPNPSPATYYASYGMLADGYCRYVRYVWVNPTRNTFTYSELGNSQRIPPVQWTVEDKLNNVWNTWNPTGYPWGGGDRNDLVRYTLAPYGYFDDGRAEYRVWSAVEKVSDQDAGIESSRVVVSETEPKPRFIRFGNRVRMYHTITPHLSHI